MGGRRPVHAGRGRYQRFGVRHAVGLLIVGAFGATLVYASARAFHDHAILTGRGVTTTAHLDRVRHGRGGPSVDVTFTTADGRRVETGIGDAASADGLRAGRPILVRYDPLDLRRVATADDSEAVISRWLDMGLGVGLLGLVGYGCWWWSRAAHRRPP